jgi:phi13 family phage major tail protein
MSNKIKYGLRNVYYALFTEDGTYETPKQITTATSISLKPANSELSAYGDDVQLVNKQINRGYTGSISFQVIPDDFLIDVLGMTKDSNGGLVESSNDNPHEAALLFEFQGDQSARRHVLYRVSFARPNIESESIADKVSTKESSLDITVMPVVGGDLDGKIKEHMDDTTETHTAYQSWYTQVYIPTVGGGTEA